MAPELELTEGIFRRVVSRRNNAVRNAVAAWWIRPSKARTYAERWVTAVARPVPLTSAGPVASTATLTGGAITGNSHDGARGASPP